MKLRRILIGAGLAALLPGLSACTKMHTKAALDSSRLALSPLGVQPKCTIRLKEVVDARAHGASAGRLSSTVIDAADAVSLVRKQLLAAGLRDETSDAAHGVTVHLKRFYIAQNLSTKIPVVVYEASMDDQPGLLIRPQATSINWTDSESNIYEAFNSALRLANDQLISELNKHCN